MELKKPAIHFILAICMLIPYISMAQKVETYKGTLAIGKYSGQSIYTYKVVGNDTILHGDFNYQTTNPRALLEEKDVSFDIKGEFKNNIPVGSWNFRFNEFQSSKKSKVKDNTYILSVNGKQRVAFGNFNAGNPDGEWTLKIQQIKNSEVETVDFTSVIEFKDGIPQRNFKIRDEYQELVGRFLRNGFAHDRWTLFSDNALEEIESWNFSEGILQTIEINNGGSSKKIEIHTDVLEKTEEITLDEKYLKILALIVSEEDKHIITKGGIADLLRRNYKYYSQIDTIVSALSTTSFRPKFKTKVPYYPLLASEKKVLAEIANYYQKSKEISDFLLSDTQLNIKKLLDKDVRALEDTVEAITENILAPLAKMKAGIDDALIPYVQREQLINTFWGAYNFSITGFEEYGIKIKNKLQNKQDPLEIVQLLSKETFNRLNAINEELEKKVDRQEKQKEAIALEKEMIAQLKYVRTVEKSAKVDSIPSEYYYTIQQLYTDTEQKLSQYATIKDVDIKIKTGKELVGCFKNRSQIADYILKLPEQKVEMNTKYTDAVWNPFVATVMEETVKKRIISAYENVLIPYFLETIQQGLSCTDEPKWIQLVDQTHQRMLLLREEETKRLERKLKKENDPLIVLQRFQINSLLNQQQ